jgi:hypothetical protein
MGASSEFDDLTPLFCNFVGVHPSDEEYMFAFCIRRVNPGDLEGRTVQIHPHTRIFVSRNAVKKLYLCLRAEFGNEVE